MLRVRPQLTAGIRAGSYMNECSNLRFARSNNGEAGNEPPQRRRPVAGDPGRERGSEGARERGNKGARERGNEPPQRRRPVAGDRGRERGSKGAREQGSRGARERGSKGAREQRSEGTREQGSEGASGDRIRAAIGDAARRAFRAAVRSLLYWCEQIRRRNGFGKRWTIFGLPGAMPTLRRPIGANAPVSLRRWLRGRAIMAASFAT